MPLNCKCRNTRGQLTRISKYISENGDLDIAEIQAQLDIPLKTKDKPESQKEEYYIIRDDKF